MNIQSSLYDAYGGTESISRIVLSFYDKVIAEPALFPYFAKTDMRTLVEHQTSFVASIMGGPAGPYSEELRETHQHLDIDGDSFDLMISIFQQTLLEHEFENQHAEEIIADLRARRDLIVTS